MLNIVFIRNFPDKFDQCMICRGETFRAIKVLALDNKIRKVKTNIQQLQLYRNNISKIKYRVSLNKQDDSSLILQATQLKKKIHYLKSIRDSLLIKMNNLLNIIPNVLLEDIPYGSSDKDNIVVRKGGIIINSINVIRSHYEIGERLRMLDSRSAVKISGSRFTVLRKDLAKLERSLVNFMLDCVTVEHGYEEISPPYIVSESTMYKVGHLPKFAGDTFSLSNSSILIPTAEVPLCAMLSNDILSSEKFPIRYTAFTPCFRSEAGSGGRDIKGLIRLHQFGKVELFSATLPDSSPVELERIVGIAEKILCKLKLPYRIVLLCSQDTGFCSAKTYDLQVWLPHQQKYMEISSCSNCLEFQSVRMNAKYKLHNGENSYFHTLNGSCLAVGRTIAAILENYQNDDGSVTVPSVLLQYMQQDHIVSAEDVNHC